MIAYQTRNNNKITPINTDFYFQRLFWIENNYFVCHSSIWPCDATVTSSIIHILTEFETPSNCPSWFSHFMYQMHQVTVTCPQTHRPDFTHAQTHINSSPSSEQRPVKSHPWHQKHPRAINRFRLNSITQLWFHCLFFVHKVSTFHLWSLTTTV